MMTLHTLDYLVIHCTDTPEARPVSKEDILRWHTKPLSAGGRGWKVPGYRDMIYLDGQLINLVPFNSDNLVDPWEITNGVAGMNGKAVHIVYVGGKDRDNKNPKDTRTKSQLETMELYVKYTIKRYPSIQVLGHYEAPTANGKTCPCFNVPDWLRSIGVAEKNIFSKGKGHIVTNSNSNRKA